jgi:glucose-6-phosphate 1-dehydrogenase
MQLLSLIAMEPPAVVGADEVRDEKIKVLRAVRAEGAPDDWGVRGQYGPGTMGGAHVRAFREEDRIARDSIMETYAAVRLYVDTWRWAGVPFLLRTGKRLAARRTEIAVCFRPPPTRLFRTVICAGDLCQLAPQVPNMLVFRIQPDEGAHLVLSVKRPGMTMDIHQAVMTFDYSAAFPGGLPEAYERLLVDVLRGDQTLFTRSDESERAWEVLDPLIAHWSRTPPLAFPNYAAGSWGPAEADRLTAGCAAGWQNGGSGGVR